MLSNLINSIPELIKNYGILAVIIGVAIETIVVPLPSPLIVMAAGYILIPQGSLVTVLLNALWISLFSGIAQTIGSYLLYSIGYFGGKPIIDKYEKYHGVSWHDITEFQKKFGKGRKEDFTLFLLRALPIMPLSVVSGVAGVMKMNLKRYTIATLFGVIPRNFILALMGYGFGEFYLTIAPRIDHAETFMTLIIVGLIALYIIGHKTGMIDKIRKNVLK